ncbi:synaptonemal complex central element protein 1-like [Sminthopsis crassicaudata]|uniref:synaptonemal complex central element protein 1-like n=1 Tax=Sminthopsis crassicaudata TaxID=9301 RepID=UPI003D695799
MHALSAIKRAGKGVALHTCDRELHAEGKFTYLVIAEDLLWLFNRMEEEDYSFRMQEMISVINQLQQAQKCTNEELQRNRHEMETLKEELDKLNLETVQLEETLSMKQGTLLLLQEHRREEEKKLLR